MRLTERTMRFQYGGVRGALRSLDAQQPSDLAVHRKLLGGTGIPGDQRLDLARLRAGQRAERLCGEKFLPLVQFHQPSHEEVQPTL